MKIIYFSTKSDCDWQPFAPFNPAAREDAWTATENSGDTNCNLGKASGVLPIMSNLEVNTIPNRVGPLREFD